MPKLLELTRFGNPILREVARQLSVEEIHSPEIQELIANIRYTNQQKEQGVALAAQQVGETEGMWEGCMSCGGADNMVFGRAQRYPFIRAAWYDEHGVLHNEELSGFVAHVFQHETDHTHGILFVDKVSDTWSYMMVDEYRKRIINKQNR